MEDSLQFIESFFNELNNNEIEYCILRNADEVERGDAHDIDMTVRADKLAQTESIILKIASKLGWRLHYKTGSSKDDMNIKNYHVSKILTDSIKIVHIDIFPTFSWQGYILLDNKTLLENIIKDTIYHKANPSVEAVTKLFIRLLHNGYIKTKYKKYVQTIFDTNGEETRSCLLNFLDSPTAEFIMSSVHLGEWEKIEKFRNQIVDVIKKNSRKDIIKQKKYLFNKMIHKAGLMVAFEGTDGSGKSTIIEGLSNALENSFPGGMFDYYHWRPGVIKKEKKAIDGNKIEVTEPHAKKPYGRIKSFAKFMFFNIDYVVGYWTKVRWQISKGHLVIFDRYYYDYYLDKLRYRLTISDKTLDFFRLFIPKTDITFLLVGDAQILYERKKEISVEEIQKQVERLMKNRDKFRNSVVIDVNQSINKVVFEASSAILYTCAQKLGNK